MQNKRKDSRPSVKLTGNDGNVFNIIGAVSKTLKRAGLGEQAEEFTNRAFAAESYDQVLQLAMKYCDVS